MQGREGDKEGGRKGGREVRREGGKEGGCEEETERWIRNINFKSCYLDLIKEVLEVDKCIQTLAKELYEQKSLLILGRGYNFATCLEGALVSIHPVPSCSKGDCLNLGFICSEWRCL